MNSHTTSISNCTDFLAKFQAMTEKQRNLHFAHWRECFCEEEYPRILQELNLSGTEKKVILSPFREEKHPSFSISFMVDEPMNNFLFFDFRTQQKGAGTLAYRLCQAGLSTDSSTADDFLLQIAVQRDYPTYFSSNNMAYIDVVERYKLKIQAIFDYLIQEKIINVQPFSLENCFSNIVTLNVLPSTLSIDLEKYLAEKFNDEFSEQITSSNKYSLNETHDFLFQQVPLWFNAIREGDCIAVFDATGTHIINLLQHDHLVIPYHKFDSHIVPLVNWQAQQKIYNQTTQQNQTKCVDVGFLGVEDIPTMPTARLAKSYMVWHKRIPTPPLNYRNAAYLLLKFGQNFHFPDNVELAFVAAIYNQLQPEQYILIQGIELFKWLANTHQLLKFRECVQLDLEQLNNYAQSYQNTTDERQRKRFGMVVTRSKVQEAFTKQLNKVLDVLCQAELQGLDYLLALRSLNPVISTAYESKNGLTQLPEFEESQYMQLPEVVSRLNLNNALTNNLDTHSPVFEQFTVERGISEQIQRKFSLGYGTLDILNRCLEMLNFSPIYYRDSQKHKMVFNDKIIFPIRDWYGHTLAFGARQLDPNVSPKYINSRNLEVFIPKRINEVFRVFDKTHTWYGLYESKAEIIKQKRMLVVEGYMDCLVCHQHGLEHTVATMGTNVSLEKLQPLLPSLNEVTVMLDGDMAGIIGMLNLARLVMENELEDKFSFVVLPNQLDPDDYIKEYGIRSLEDELNNRMNCRAYIQKATETLVFNTQNQKWLTDEERLKRRENGFVWAKYLMMLE